MVQSPPVPNPEKSWVGRPSPAALTHGEKLILIVQAKSAGIVLNVNGVFLHSSGQAIPFTHTYTTLAAGAIEKSVILQFLGEIV